MFKLVSVLLGSLLLLVAAGCKPKAASITSLQRKEAANLVSEAQFAMSIRDYARAEGLLTKATALEFDNGNYWISLGSMRVRLGQRPAAKAAYESALHAFEEAYKLEPTVAQPYLQQVYALALLGARVMPALCSSRWRRPTAPIPPSALLCRAASSNRC